jgi:hypothetical protein
MYFLDSIPENDGLIPGSLCQQSFITLYLNKTVCSECAALLKLRFLLSYCIKTFISLKSANVSNLSTMNRKEIYFTFPFPDDSLRKLLPNVFYSINILVDIHDRVTYKGFVTFLV